MVVHTGREVMVASKAVNRELIMVCETDMMVYLDMVVNNPDTVVHNLGMALNQLRMSVGQPDMVASKERTPADHLEYVISSDISGNSHSLSAFVYHRKYVISSHSCIQTSSSSLCLCPPTDST